MLLVFCILLHFFFFYFILFSILYYLCISPSSHHNYCTYEAVEIQRDQRNIVIGQSLKVKIGSPGFLTPNQCFSSIQLLS